MILFLSVFFPIPVSRIAMVKPSKARQIQDLLLRMAQSGQIKQKISEQQLIGLLDQVEQAQGGGDDNRGKITVSLSSTESPAFSPWRESL